MPLLSAKQSSIEVTRMYRCGSREVAMLVSFNKALVANHKKALTRRFGFQYDEVLVSGETLLFRWPDRALPNGEGQAVHLFGDDAVMVIGIRGVTKSQEDSGFISAC